LIVARMLGFVFNPLTHRLEKTGLVYVSTNPPDAAVVIDGRMAHQRTPTVIRDLPPGNHFIRIELNGYNDWERTIPIVGKKATVLANTLLIPEEWPLIKISRQPYQNIMIADDVLVATNPLLKNIDIFNTTQGMGENLFTQNSVYANGSLVRLFNEPQSPYILLEISIKDTPKFLWVNLKENPPIIEDISDLFTGIPNLISWDNADNGDIYAFYAQNVYRINIKDKTVFPQKPENLPVNLSRQPAPAPSENFLINGKNDLLTRQGMWIQICPKEYFGKPRVYDIAKSSPSTNMYFEEKNGKLFYLDNDTGFLYTAQILSFETMLNIPIPEGLRIKISPQEPKL
jgi:hypothetical protein